VFPSTSSAPLISHRQSSRSRDCGGATPRAAKQAVSDTRPLPCSHSWRVVVVVLERDGGSSSSGAAAEWGRQRPTLSSKSGQIHQTASQIRPLCSLRLPRARAGPVELPEAWMTLLCRAHVVAGGASGSGVASRRASGAQDPSPRSSAALVVLAMGHGGPGSAPRCGSTFSPVASPRRGEEAASSSEGDNHSSAATTTTGRGTLATYVAASSARRRPMRQLPVWWWELEGRRGGAIGTV
jgi:hypothetical protein